MFTCVKYPITRLLHTSGYLIAGILLSGLLSAQETRSEKSHFHVVKQATVRPSDIQEDWHPSLQHLEMPVPGGKRDWMRKRKRKLRQLFPHQQQEPSYKQGIAPDTAPQPIINHGFEGNPYNFSVPNDNHLAVSDDRFLLSAINSSLYGYDVEADSLIYNISLNAFASELGISGSKYDPKLIYDPATSRFIIVFLNGSLSSSSMIIVGFSTATHPDSTWHLYALEGNPLKDTSWSDYPAISVSKTELFITVNLLKDNVSWQEGFRQSVIWQMDKQAAYQGDTAVDAMLWHDITYNDNYVRNLHPVRGGMWPYGPNLYCLSNHNFALQSDTFYLVEVRDSMGGADSELVVQVALANAPYGMPPLARQAEDRYLATNDARVLGAFLEDSVIQLVGNTVNPATGLAAVYHGTLYGAGAPDPVIDGHILGDTVLDYGYPNIAFTGDQPCDHEAMIIFNHSAPTVYDGVSAVYYSNDHVYSPSITLKEGLGHIDILSDSVDRWGDYSGLQRIYNDRRRVWAAGSWGKANNRTATWISELLSPDTSILFVSQLVDSADVTDFGRCNGKLQVEVVGGNPPYTIQWDDPEAQTTPIAENLCAGDYTVTVIDESGCTYTKTTTITQPDPRSVIFPNPVADQLSVYFDVPQAQPVRVDIYDMQGRHIRHLMSEQAKAGKNVFSFSTVPLANGVYVVKVSGESGDVFVTEKIVKLSQITH